MYRITDEPKLVTEDCSVQYRLDDGTDGAVRISATPQRGVATPISPWGKALLGKKIDDSFTVILPRDRQLTGTVTSID